MESAVPVTCSCEPARSSVQRRYAGGPEPPFGLVVQGLTMRKLEAGPQRFDVRSGTDLGLAWRLATRWARGWV